MNSKKKSIPVEIRKKIRENLSSGDLTLIAMRVNTNVSNVYSFFRGDGNRIDILEAAINIIETRKGLINKLNKW